MSKRIQETLTICLFDLSSRPSAYMLAEDQFFRDKVGLLGGCPVQCPSLLNDPVEGTNNFLHRYGYVRTMCEDDIHIFQAKPVQGRSGALNHTNDHIQV
jgi:hypothetical protein